MKKSLTTGIKPIHIFCPVDFSNIAFPVKSNMKYTVKIMITDKKKLFKASVLVII